MTKFKESFDFIERKLDDLLVKFPTAKVRYELCEDDDTHYAEVLPQRVYDSLDFKEWKANVRLEFIRQFPDQGICFVSENALISIATPNFEKKETNDKQK